MQLSNKELAELLLKEKYVEEQELKEAFEATERNGSSLYHELTGHGIITNDLFGQAMAEYFRVPYADLNTNVPSKEQVLKIPEEFARHYRVVVFAEDAKQSIIASDHPDDALAVIEQLRDVLGKDQIAIAYSLPEDIDSVFVYYRRTLETRFVKILEQKKRIAPELVDEIIVDALIYRSSDIHIEPHDAELVIRFRIDGVLQEAGRIDKKFYDNILNRVKVLAHLRTDEHSRPQDGAIRFNHEGTEIDLRVSIAPTIEGEKIVIRVLGEYVRNFTLHDLGMNARDESYLVEASHKPFGMILAAGPTGSGKTTTMYSVLKLLNKPEINIATIEDPVEYKLAGVNHIQVNEQSGISFASGLRSIVRQDPDIILVGEIRDKETAEIAVNAALTGHLVISTFHANDAVTAIPRLLDMGVEPFLLASTFELIIAQRLARKLCDHCRVSYTISRDDLAHKMPAVERFFTGHKVTLYRSKGCATCSNLGYRGRVALFEVIRMTLEMQDLILKNPAAHEIWALAKKQGARSLFDDGIEKAQSGMTSLEEVLRVVSPPRV